MVIFENVFHEVWAVGLGGDALVDFFAGPSVVSHGHFFDGRGGEPGDYGVHWGEVVEDGEDLGEFHAFEYGCYL